MLYLFMANYHNLIVFQKADKLALEIYRLTKTFPRTELFGITSQLRRAALSIPTNIVEGYTRKNKNELRQFINIALGSHAETSYLFNFSKKLNYIKEEPSPVDSLIDEVGKLLWRFNQSI